MVEHEPPRRIDLDRDHHNGHLNEEKEGFDECYPLIVHCHSKEHALEVSRLITEAYHG